MSCFKNMVAGCVVCVFGFCGSANAVTLTWDFEGNSMADTSGTYFFANVSGTSFLDQPVPYAGGDSNNPFGGGTYLARSDHSQVILWPARSDAHLGVMESGAFTLEASAMLSFEEHGAGGTIQVVESGSDVVLETVTPNLASVTMQQFSADLSAHNGKTVYLRVSDTSNGGWGHVAIDNIVVTNVAEPPTAPEPSALVLAALSLVGLAMRRSRRVRN